MLGISLFAAAIIKPTFLNIARFKRTLGLKHPYSKCQKSLKLDSAFMSSIQHKTNARVQWKS